MGKIGIIIAMDEELEELKKYFKIEKEFNIFELKFYEGKISDVDCIVVKCGVGKVNAARTTQILIDNMQVDYIFNVGVAGGVSNKLTIGDIVIGEKLIQHDFDVTALNYEKGFIPEVGSFIEADTYLVTIANEVLKKFNNLNVFRGVIASGDIFCTDVKMSEKINTKFNALCVEMESASIAQVCYLNHIPFLILRSISDVPNNNNAITFEEFVSSSSNVVALALCNILKELNK